MNSTRRNTLRNLDDNGAVLLIVALSSVALLGFLGLAMDVGYMYHHRRVMQTAADAGALAGGAEIERGQTTAIVQSSAHAATTKHNFAHGVSGVQVTVHHPPVNGSYAGNNKFVEVLIERPLPIFIMRLFGHDTMRIPARAVAGVGGNAKSCIYVLDSDAEASFQASSSVEVNASCGISIDSDHPNAMDLNSRSEIQATGVAITGNYTTQSNATVTPTPSTGVPRAGDPLPPGLLPAPAVKATCDYTNTKFHNQTVTVNPGVYCGGIWISNSTVNFNPGVYIMVGGQDAACDTGSLHIASNGRLIGNGVMFYITESPTLQPSWGGSEGKYRPVIFESSPFIQLTASRTEGDPYQGILFFNDRSIPEDRPKCLPSEKSGQMYPWTHEFESSADSSMEGVWYFPNHLVKFESSTNASAATYSVLVVRAVQLQSSTNWNLGSDFSVLPGGSPIKRLTLVE